MSDPASRLATPDLQINKISVQLVANLDTATSSASSSEAKGHNASSLSTGSDFEFDSSFLPKINEDPPVSPKLIRPSTAATYWGGFSNNGRLEMIMPQAQISNPLFSSPPDTPVIKKNLAPSSPSVSHLKAEDYKDYDFNNYFLSSSAPQTPNLHFQQKQGGHLPKQCPTQDSTSFWGINNNDQRRSKSSMLDRRALDLSPLMMQKEVYLAGGLEHNYIVPSSSSSSSSACNGSSPTDTNEELIDEHKYAYTSMERTATRKDYNKKHRSRNSNKKCTLKDFLGWDVNPSSIITRAADPHHDHSCKYARTSFESPGQSTSSSIRSPKPHYLLSGLRKTTPNSPAASPPRSPPAAAVKHAPPPTLPHGRPSPISSPPRPPMSPHALHYKQQKARSDELRRETFLPYRQSLLGCLGGATMSDSRALQHVW